MTYNNSYIMKEQVRNLIPSLMACNPTRKSFKAESKLHLVSVAIVTSVYLFAVVISG
jgi:hypothetical protein